MATIMLELTPVRHPREVYVRRRLAAALVLSVLVVALLMIAGLAARTLSESPGGTPASVAGRTPAAASAPAIDPSATPARAAPSVYMVREGDTLWSIGESLGIERVAAFVDDVAELNGTSSLEVGMRLVLPR